MIGALVGGALSFLATWLFYRKSAEDLEEEARKLHTLNVLTIRMLDEAKLLPENVEPTKDEDGEYTGGFTKYASAKISGGSAVSVNAEVTRADDPDTPEQEPKNAEKKEDSPDKNKRNS